MQIDEKSFSGYYTSTMKRSDVRNLVSAVTAAKTEPVGGVTEPFLEPTIWKQESFATIQPMPEPVVTQTPNLTGVSADAAYAAWLLGAQGQKLRHLGGVDPTRLHHAYADRVSAIFRAGFEAGSR